MDQGTELRNFRIHVAREGATTVIDDREISLEAGSGHSLPTELGILPRDPSNV